ncbi:hypothetical protein A0H81_05022 [Grifola frondosa]|uniref:Uncharacterized protein n=1 Tax=Grifola frondosa TaxID=5627 RepID=A0A1C7ME41_GRIFR|nr:hypothetical protein A0H81_05022 [Grifola frondosa]
MDMLCVVFGAYGQGSAFGFPAIPDGGRRGTGRTGAALPRFSSVLAYAVIRSSHHVTRSNSFLSLSALAVPRVNAACVSQVSGTAVFLCFAAYSFFAFRALAPVDEFPYRTSRHPYCLALCGIPHLPSLTEDMLSTHSGLLRVQSKLFRKYAQGNLQAH